MLIHWLLLVPAVQHIVQIQDAIKKLLQDLPKFDKRITANDEYLFIKRSLESKVLPLEMEFVVSIKPLFDDFMTKFQKRGTSGSCVTQQLPAASEGSSGEAAEECMFCNKEGKELTNINVDDLSLQLVTEDFKTIQVPKVVMLLKELPKVAQRKAVLGMKSFYDRVVMAQGKQRKVALGRLLKNACFCNKEGKELTNINVDDLSLQLVTEDFKTIQVPKVVMLLKELPKVAQRKAVLGMKSFYDRVVMAQGKQRIWMSVFETGKRQGIWLQHREKIENTGEKFWLVLFLLCNMFIVLLFLSF